MGSFSELDVTLWQDYVRQYFTVAMILEEIKKGHETAINGLQLILRLRKEKYDQDYIGYIFTLADTNQMPDKVLTDPSGIVLINLFHGDIRTINDPDTQEQVEFYDLVKSKKDEIEGILMVLADFNEKSAQTFLEAYKENVFKGMNDFRESVIE